MKKHLQFFSLSFLLLFLGSTSNTFGNDHDICLEGTSFNSVSITASAGAIQVTSTAGTINKIVCVKDWVETTYCDSDCGTSRSFNLSAGSYIVKVWVGASWILFEEEVVVPSGSSGGGAAGGGAAGGGATGGGAGAGVQTLASRTASNTTACTGAFYGGYIAFDGYDRSYRIESGQFVEFSDGTALLTGRWINNSDRNIAFNVNISFSGRTFSAPVGSPKDDICGLNQETGGFYYYPSVSGTLTGIRNVSGFNLSVFNVGPAFQVGRGANITSNTLSFGASGWLGISVLQRPSNVTLSLIVADDGQFADININLSGAPLTGGGTTGGGTAGGGTAGGGTAGGGTTGGGTAGGGTAGGGTAGGGTAGGGTAGGGTAGGGTTSGSPTCPTVSGGNGQITVSGSGIQKIAYVNSSGGDEVICSGTCGTSRAFAIAAGTYTVKVWFGNSWELCSTSVTVSGGGTAGGGAGGGGAGGGGAGGGGAGGGGAGGGGAGGGGTGGGGATGGGSPICFVASNTSFCLGYETYGGFLIIDGQNGFYSIQNGSFIQNNDGTATLTGTWVNIANSNIYFEVIFYFSGGYTNTAPKAHVCGLAQGTAISYTSVTGVLTGGGAVNGVVLNATGTGPDFQVGQNANITNAYDSFGGSGWLTITIVSGNISIGVGENGQNADININLWNSACSRTAEFTNFNAYEGNRAVELEWLTNTTYRSDAYVVEKSVNGADFEVLSTVNNDAYSLDVAYFQEVDDNPVLGENHYRLKQIFDDGSYEYSAVRTIQYGIDLSAIEAFPNPAQNELYINLQEFAGQQASITISNQFGVIVEDIQLAELPNDLLKIDVSSYLNGLYIMSTKIDKRKFITKKIIVNKMY